MQWRRGEMIISDDRSAVDVALVADWLARTHWGYRRAPETVKKLVANSLCFSLLLPGRYVGFARIVTDRTVFSWLSDLIVDEAFRGRGLGRWLIECILSHPDVAPTQIVLQTSDGHGLYAKFGFEASTKLMSRPTEAMRTRHESTGPGTP